MLSANRGYRFACGLVGFFWRAVDPLVPPWLVGQHHCRRHATLVHPLPAIVFADQHVVSRSWIIAGTDMISRAARRVFGEIDLCAHTFVHGMMFMFTITESGIRITAEVANHSAGIRWHSSNRRGRKRIVNPRRDRKCNPRIIASICRKRTVGCEKTEGNLWLRAVVPLQTRKKFAIFRIIGWWPGNWFEARRTYCRKLGRSFLRGNYFVGTYNAFAWRNELFCFCHSIFIAIFVAIHRIFSNAFVQIIMSGKYITRVIYLYNI
jgi:hypothetical protein